jgi:uncharacterized protein YggT (Ycf19 family)
MQVFIGTTIWLAIIGVIVFIVLVFAFIRRTVKKAINTINTINTINGKNKDINQEIPQ